MSEKTINFTTPNTLGGFLSMLLWIAGIVLASGFWSTFFAIFFPPWGWYLSVEFLIRHLFP